MIDRTFLKFLLVFIVIIGASLIVLDVAGGGAGTSVPAAQGTAGN